MTSPSDAADQAYCRYSCAAFRSSRTPRNLVLKLPPRCVLRSIIGCPLSRCTWYSGPQCGFRYPLQIAGRSPLVKRAKTGWPNRRYTSHPPAPFRAASEITRRVATSVYSRGDADAKRIGALTDSAGSAIGRRAAKSNMVPRSPTPITLNGRATSVAAAQAFALAPGWP